MAELKLVEPGEEKHQLKSAPAKFRLPGWKTFIAQLQCRQASSATLAEEIIISSSSLVEGNGI